MLHTLGPGSHVLSVNDVYGGTFRYMKRVAEEAQGLETTFMDLENVDEDVFRAAIRENTKVRWCIRDPNLTNRLLSLCG